MSDEPQQTYSAREIVLEFFPATHQRLIPTSSSFHLAPGTNGALGIYNASGAALLELEPVSRAGNSKTQLCCDFCQRSAARTYLQLFRVEVPGSHGRRYIYVSLCRDQHGCELRRLSDEPLRALLARAFS